jgi:hypothetical protein
MTDAAPADTLPDADAGVRVAFATGALLTAGDFLAEQDYHRGRLGRLAAYLHGAGTVAGLDVTVEPARGDSAELKVAPGLAVDRLGRLVELDRTSCLRVSRWLDQQPAEVVTAAVAGDVVVIDVFARFHPCPGVLQPAFATSNMDTLDAALPSRVRDHVALGAHLRPAGEAPLPRATVPDLGVDAGALRDFKRRVLWGQLQLREERRRDGRLLPLGPEHVPALHDGTELLLARVTAPAVVDAGAGRPRLDPGRDIAIDNDVRLYSYGNAELALLAGLER